MESIYGVFIVVFMIGCGYSVYKYTQYRTDERGKTIILNASNLVIGTIYILFGVFSLYILVVSALELDIPTIDLFYLRNVVAGIMAMLTTINLIAIVYFQKKI